jgi:hypothetical protein
LHNLEFRPAKSFFVFGHVSGNWFAIPEDLNIENQRTNSYKKIQMSKTNNQKSI